MATLTSVKRRRRLHFGDNFSRTWNYSDSLKAWDANVNVSVDNGKSYFVDGGTNTTADTGPRWRPPGCHSARTPLAGSGTAATLTKDVLSFASDDATIQFGTAATISKSGCLRRVPTSRFTSESQTGQKVHYDAVARIAH
ncbi:hypothetical protein JKP88DRAFT_256014 [Tribonema minus]|uniref:Uncharacterized protein n=1 Tax=Tribonema minus TaxID=303371 RepID=A0A835YW50_9STRA|nr:hypothetical protein JKP88DRAFT_256014 [Tribonema minus]